MVPQFREIGMKKVIFIAALVAFTAHAGSYYQCEFAKQAGVKPFKITTLTKSDFDATLDGNFDSVTPLNDKILQYYFNNGCDNDITFRIHKDVPEYRPYKFNMRVDYYAPDEHLTDTEVFCDLIEEN